ncbi:MAG: hypothetical protein E6K53_00640 [Gammaproteobacteria bacterium]|nr:MAG: hypothetical protein E6K53_00640 [Gammaproteobacteria bacterium]
MNIVSGARAMLEPLLRKALDDLQAGRYRSGHSHALSALRLAPTQAKPVLELLRLLNFVCEPDAALTLLRDTEIGAWTTTAVLEAAMIASNCGGHVLAERLCANALAQDPESALAHYIDATLSLFAGRTEYARQAIERALARAPAMSQAWWVLSQLGGATSDQIAQLRLLLKSVPRNSSDAIQLSFAAHHLLHEQGDHADAWHALERGCAAKRAQLRYEHAAEIALLERIAAQCAARFCRTNAHAAPRGGPVFIIGMHRSGTTLLEQLLAGHSQIEPLGETYRFAAQLRLAADHHCAGVLDAHIAQHAAQFDFGAIGAGYLAGVLGATQGKAYWTEKLPSNFVALGYIAKALPQAKFLHLVRDPRDLCFSNLRMLFSNVNGYSYEQLQLSEFHRAYRGLMRHWHTVLPGRICDVAYAQLAAEPATTLRRVCMHLGVEFEPSMLTPAASRHSVSSASAAQVRGRIRPSGAQWQYYETQLQPLLQRLAASTIAP